MASVKAPQSRVKKESSNRFAVLVVKILLVLIILLLLPKLVEAKGRLKARVKKKRRAEVVMVETRKRCEMEVCSRFTPEECMNCVQLCISPACYQDIYGSSPLEDGEIDVDRATQFEICAKTEMKAARKLQRQNPQLFGE